MKIDAWICDHCGKEIDVNLDYIEAEYEGPGFYEVMDLCEKCHEELKEFIENFAKDFPKQG